MADIKDLLDGIIERTNTAYPASANNVTSGNLGALHKVNTPTTFDKGAFKEKLAMYVLKDVIQAMMMDDTSDLDNTIDTAILRHMKDDCGCSCYNYLSNARHKLKSDLLGDIIQEIDDKTEEVAAKVSITKDPSVADQVDVKEILKNVDNYDDFTKLMKEKTSSQVVEQMKNVILKSNDAPAFDGDKIDQKIGNPDNKAVEESSIMNIYSTIIYESYVDGKPTISSDMGMEMAFVEYCIDQLDHAFLATPKRALMARYR